MCFTCRTQTIQTVSDSPDSDLSVPKVNSSSLRLVNCLFRCTETLLTMTSLCSKEAVTFRFKCLIFWTQTVQTVSSPSDKDLFVAKKKNKNINCVEWNVYVMLVILFSVDVYVRDFDLKLMYHMCKLE